MKIIINSNEFTNADDKKFTDVDNNKFIKNGITNDP